MIKIRISYTEDKDLHRALEALKGLKIISLSKEYAKKGCKNRYIEIE